MILTHIHSLYCLFSVLAAKRRAVAALSATSHALSGALSDDTALDERADREEAEADDDEDEEGGGGGVGGVAGVGAHMMMNRLPSAQIVRARRLGPIADDLSSCGSPSSVQSEPMRVARRSVGRRRKRAVFTGRGAETEGEEVGDEELTEDFDQEEAEESGGQRKKRSGRVVMT